MPRHPLSPQKKYEIVRLWLVERLTYEEIKEKTGVSVGGISETVNEFKEKAKGMSLEEAARIFGVVDEVSALLDLSDDLKRAGLTLHEAKEGVALLKDMRNFGVTADNVRSWIELCRRLSQPNYPVKEFVSSSIRLMSLEAEYGVNYESLIGDFEAKAKERERLSKELQELAQRLQALKTEVEKIDGELRSKKETMQTLSKMESKLKTSIESYEARLKELQEKAQQNVQLEEDLRNKREQCEALDKSIGEKKGELSRLEDEHKGFKEKIDACRKEYEELNSKLERLRSEYNTLSQKVVENRRYCNLAKLMLNGYMPIPEFKIPWKCKNCSKEFDHQLSSEFVQELAESLRPLRPLTTMLSYIARGDLQKLAEQFTQEAFNIRDEMKGRRILLSWEEVRCPYCQYIEYVSREQIASMLEEDLQLGEERDKTGHLN